MNLATIWTISRRELREGLRHKWLWAYVIGFAGLAAALSGTSLAVAGYAGLGGFGRTAASLVNALLLFIPLLGLSIGAGSVAGDRERGTLLYVLSQPVSRGEVLAGKALGSGLALTLAVLLLPVPRRASAALVLVALVLHLSLLNNAPASAYFAQTLQTWEQGRFIRFNGLAQWLGWLWPYATLVYVLLRVSGRDAQT